MLLLGGSFQVRVPHPLTVIQKACCPLKMMQMNLMQHWEP